jgi:hypothetical protein
MRDEQLRTRLQALAAAGQQEPQASTLRAVRRRGRRRVRNALVLTVAGVLALVGGVRLLPEQRERTVVPVAPGGAPATFIGLAQQNETARLAVIDAATGRIRRWLPGVKLSGTYALDPGLRRLYRYQWDKAPCARTWTEIDLTTGATRPAFGGRPAAPAPVPSPDGRWVAFTACPPPGLAVLDVVGGKQRVLRTPKGVERLDWPLQWSPDSTRLGILLRRPGRPRAVFQVVPAEGAGSITQGRALELPHRPGCEPQLPPRFRDNQRVLVVEQCRTDTFLVDLDVRTGRQLARTALGLRAGVSDVAVDRSGEHVLLLAVQRKVKQQPPSIYVVRDGRAARLPNDCGCWQVAW